MVCQAQCPLAGCIYLPLRHPPQGNCSHRTQLSEAEHEVHIFITPNLAIHGLEWYVKQFMSL